MSAEDTVPEWFQMTQTDGFEPKPKGKRVMRIMALATPLFVLGAGLVFAQTQDSPSATASAVASAPSSSTDAISLSTTPAATTPVATTPVATTPAPAAPTASSAVSISQASSVTPSAKASITIKKPAITMPTGGGEDDGLRNSDDD